MVKYWKTIYIMMNPCQKCLWILLTILIKKKKKRSTHIEARNMFIRYIINLKICIMKTLSSNSQEFFVEPFGVTYKMMKQSRHRQKLLLKSKIIISNYYVLCFMCVCVCKCVFSAGENEKLTQPTHIIISDYYKSLLWTTKKTCV